MKHLLHLLIYVSMSIPMMSCGTNPKLDTGGPENPADGTGAPYPNFHGQEVKGEKNFAFLINNYAQGKIEPTPWAGYWWPYTKNGIAAGSYVGNYSPAGKYDAARGGMTQAQNWEVRNHGAGVPRVQSWWGHCNGWCVAAALFPEPDRPISVNGIIFGIGDIKGLLTEVGMSVNADFYGERVDVDDPSSPKYWDTIPDQYFLVLTNYIGRLKQAVLIDRYTGSQIWNQPLAGYRFEYPTKADYLGNSPEAPHVYRIELTSTLWWMDDGVPADVQTHAFNFEAEDPTGMVQSRTLRMELWLDGPVEFDQSGRVVSSGNVIVSRQNDTFVGGAWRVGEGFFVDAWPDYMWVPYQITKPVDPDQDYVNPQVDFEWIKAHILVPGGADDPTVRAGTITPAPIPSTAYPIPWPSAWPSAWPSVWPSVWPSITPSTTPRPVPPPVPPFAPPEPGPSPRPNPGPGAS